MDVVGNIHNQEALHSNWESSNTIDYSLVLIKRKEARHSDTGDKTAVKKEAKNSYKSDYSGSSNNLGGENSSRSI